MDKILLYSDGACIPNPGNMGVGVVLLYKGHIKEISKRIGEGTNNIAELTAIEIGLDAIKDKSKPVEIVSDSQYAINTLCGKWGAKKNTSLIYKIREKLSKFEDVSFKWVRGHSGNQYNERCDYLANKDLT